MKSFKSSIKLLMLITALFFNNLLIAADNKYPIIAEIHTAYGTWPEVTLTITGINFMSKGDAPYIFIGDSIHYDLDEDYLSDIQIVLTAMMSDGDYMVAVSTDSKFKQDKTAIYDLTIGAVGPQGSQGPEGFQGVQGIQGMQGEQGKQGIQGEQGSKGSDGPQGVEGSQGVDGPTGPVAQHQWDGTRLQFIKPDGNWGALVDLKGEPASGFNIQQACTLFTSIYQEYQNTHNTDLVTFGESFAQMNQICFDSCPDDFRTKVNDWITALENTVQTRSGKTMFKIPQKRFTLIEHSLQVAILEILSEVAIPTYCKSCGIGRMKIIKAMSMLKQFGLTLLMYSGDNSGYFPASLQKMADGGYCSFCDPVEPDPWGEDYIYYPGYRDDNTAASSTILMTSHGPDGQLGGDDDIHLYIDGHVENRK
ncbi:MAG: hypothetical protein KZQ83_06700 [gamma proteobacterium symbiont of Taylorina sp.]|nr:hypothetical protein [gamma proteobacterium symbiont of Taylorina sp.]